jgi:heterotetrameric sarcosine oxidase gamma subunit
MASSLKPRAGFSGVIPSAGTGRGVVAAERHELGLSRVIVRRGQQASLFRQVSDHFAIELPQGPRRRASRGIAFAGIAPGQWLASKEGGVNEFARDLGEQIGAAAAISDLTDAYAVLRVTGHAVRSTLAKLVPLDLHPREFAEGDIATTIALHMGVILWRLRDTSQGTPMFEVAVPRSVVDSFGIAIVHAAGEFGWMFTDAVERSLD